jgi:hypothetical protein
MLWDILKLTLWTVVELMGAFVFLYVLAGVALAYLTARKTHGAFRLASLSFVLALFFSVSFAVGRFPMPAPTLLVIALWGWDEVTYATSSPACVPTSEGCAPLERGEAYFVAPLLMQWVLWLVILLVVAALRTWVRRRKGAKAVRAAPAERS